MRSRSLGRWAMVMAASATGVAHAESTEFALADLAESADLAIDAVGDRPMSETLQEQVDDALGWNSAEVGDGLVTEPDLSFSGEGGSLYVGALTGEADLWKPLMLTRVADPSEAAPIVLPLPAPLWAGLGGLAIVIGWRRLGGC